MANKKKIPARALACLLSTAMVPGSLPMDVLTVYGAEAEEFSDGKTSEADITPLDADAVDDAVETADFTSGSEVTADVVSEEASVDVQSADPNFDYTLNETEKTLKVGDTGSVSGTAMLNSNVVVPTAISYASSNSAVVAVDPSTGFYECKAEGIAAITATVQYTDPSSYTPKTYQTVKTLNITVTKDAEPQLTVTVKQPTVSVELDAKADAVEAYDLKNNVIVENAAAVTYKLTDAVTGNDADPSAATVDKTGLVTFKKAGEYTVRAYIESRSVTINFHITKKGVPAPTITANQTDVDIELGATEAERVYNLKSILNLTDAEWTDVDIQSSDATNAEINSTDGTVKVKEAGEYTVKATVTTKGGSQSVTVNFHVTREAAAKPAITAKQKEVNITLASGKTVTYNLKANFTLSNLDWTDVDI